MAITTSAAAQSRFRQKSKLTIEQLIDIKHPSEPIWSPDGKLVAFVWDRAGVANLYIANADGSGSPKPLTSFTQGQVEGAFLERRWRSRVLSARRRSLAGRGIWRRSQARVEQTGSGQRIRPLARWKARCLRSQQSRCKGRRAALKRSDRPLALRWHRSNHRARRRKHRTAFSGLPMVCPSPTPPAQKSFITMNRPSYSGAKLVYRVSEYVPGQIYAHQTRGSKARPHR